MNAIEEWQNAKKETFHKMKAWLRLMRNRKNKNIENLSDVLTEKAYNEIDCLSCANCCKKSSPIIKHTDIKRISKYLGMKEYDFEMQYLHTDKEDDKIMKSMPCPFLQEDNHCAIYDVRPKDCEHYPHTIAMQWSSFTGYQGRNIDFCPISFQVVKGMMEQVK